MKLFSSKRRKLAVAVFLLLALFLLRPGVSPLKSRIIRAISSSIGRPVDIASVHVRLLPWPGFNLENFVVYDDPAFGAEPILRASDVTAGLRLTSLLRGRLEISRLDLSEPSLNLVHSQNGRWNLEALLERSAAIPLAPTGKTKSEPRAGFPYIEAKSARINFKNGPEKKRYALTNADFSLWQDSENTWGVRLKAQPFRTDLNVNDTGVLQVSGTWQRAASLADTPVNLEVEWSRAQLGQFTKLFTGNDQGWRGDILLNVTLTGTPANLQIASNASIQDFRRYDITSGTALRLAAHCDSEYTSLNHSFHQLQCTAPVGSGLITLKGSMGLPGSHDYGLVLTAEKVPASAAAILAQRAKSNLPDDLVAAGLLNASLHIDQHSAISSKLRIQGHGDFASFRLASASNKIELAAETVPFLVITSDFVIPWRLPTAGTATPLSAGPHIEFGPFPLGISRTLSPTVRGWINRTGYRISVSGEADAAKTLRVARMAGLTALQSAITEGSAQLDLQIAGNWVGPNVSGAWGFSPPQVTGGAKLRNLRIAPRGLGGPIEIASADLQLLSDQIRLAKLTANAAGSSWRGFIFMPRACGTPTACQAHFQLRTDHITFSDLRRWVSPGSEPGPWYRVLKLGNQIGPSFLSNARAVGQIAADHLQIQRLEAANVSAKLNLDSGKLQISDLTADFLDGHYRGEWQADFTQKPGICKSTGSLTSASLDNVGDIMNDSWISGSGNAIYELQAPCPADFWTAAEGTLQFDLSDGALPHIFLGDAGDALKVTHLAGHAQLHDGNIELKDTRLDAPDGKFEVSGTSTLKGELDLKLERFPNTGGYTITGTLSSPRVILKPNPETQARLKTEPK